ncbi:MAG: 50S ribosomal protein L9 [Candidatus Lambdaproteobacteria bacterium RIFOXYD1_FULL_56_27]|uniref:Large ribosomal subunit protein bL9 n=1 Tax=Candidatus Lambdaproteobacteria bacterium RIFOXYD2_FULL_56_26 TaxID=1817773 RepID=A0A1F6GRK4_9PROT|nr:MAG: 50S ribosomal protein L9 [Candidatus Lambdaproteobacteria bacterium RIFOXYC1_FULL_56_13]OGH00783.1 MAG: 50S ribosomal protein L9 [Candidatus Lambdaproteobacteria bacterium RIFOXYD2_FULL_56_26]OGH09952.1 MAG: 50S ribosomal protein L9 [Candidatus Lambdaproteobacteria bacterium RIFOXYD1_FULL_56_27]
MNVILTQDVYNLGSLGDEVAVKPGYARNFLIPQGKAVPVNRQNIKLIEHQRALLNKKRQEAIDNAKAFKAKLEALELVFMVKAGESGKLFGSVTQKMIADELVAQGMEIDRRMVNLSQPVKSLGTYKMAVKLHSSVVAEVTFKVAADEIIKEVKEEVLVPVEQVEEEPIEETPAPRKKGKKG